jgi:hypothetical protein
MALAPGVAGGGAGGQSVGLRYANGDALDLTGATGITGTIISQADTSVVRAIAGTLAVDGTATAGNVLWTYDADDLVEGAWLVQLTVAFASGLPARTFAAPWIVEAGYTAPAP